MQEIGPFSIGEFAEYSRTTRDTLLYYDRIGLLSPSVRGENNYRYYSSSQLLVVNVIRILQHLGMTLEEIKGLKDRRTPELTDEVLGSQIDKINKKIDDWVRAKKLLLKIRDTIQSTRSIDEGAITIQYLPAEAIILGEMNDYSRGRTVLDALLSFYNSMSMKYPGLDLNYYVWSMYSEERVRSGDWFGADRFYFVNPEGRDKKPAALYAIGYMRGGYNDGDYGDVLYRRISDYIDEHNFEICGPAYEEYPINEVCSAEPDDYLMRVMFTVREKR